MERSFLLEKGIHKFLITELTKEEQIRNKCLDNFQMIINIDIL